MDNKKEKKQVEAMALPRVLILVDSEKKRPLLFAIRKIYTRFNSYWDRFGIYIVIAGLLVNTFFLIYTPNVAALVCEILYVPGFIYNIFATVTKKRSLGQVKDAETDQPLDLVMVRIQKNNKTVQMRVTGYTGQFFIMLPPGLYEISATRLGYISQTKPLFIAPGKHIRAVNTVITLKKEVREHPLPI